METTYAFLKQNALATFLVVAVVSANGQIWLSNTRIQGLQDDVVAKLKDRMARSGASFKEALNDNLRRGLEQPTEDELARPFRVRSRPMGLRPGVELDNIGGYRPHACLLA
ncbi:MAG: hypothetical protein OXG90_05780 [Gammaproteobacteria bacterium]|nr:hypothetical protein [Gammaproteobacteria bacterium]